MVTCPDFQVYQLMMCDNEVKLGAVHRSPAIYLTAEENSARRPSVEDCDQSLPQMGSIASKLRR